MNFAVLATGAPARKKLDAARRELARIGEELVTMEDAVIPPERAADRTVAAALPLIARARSELSSIFRYRTPATFGNDAGLQVLRDALVDPAELRKQVLAVYRADSLGAGVADQERAEKLQVLTARRVALLTEEEALTRDLEESGFVVDRNAEADPELLLRVWESRA